MSGGGAAGDFARRARELAAAGPEAVCAEVLEMCAAGDAGGIMQVATGMAAAGGRSEHSRRCILAAASCALDVGNNAGALEGVRIAAGTYGWSADAWGIRGAALEASGDGGGALEAYGKAAGLAGGRKRAAALAHRAACLHNMGRHAEALGAAAEALEAAPGDEEMHVLRVSSLRSLGRHGEALEAAAEGRRAGCGPAIGVPEALALEGAGRAEEALAALAPAAREAPYAAYAWVVMARLLAKLGRAEEALDALTVAVSLDPRAVVEARKDPSMGALRGSERFERLVG